MSEHRLIVEADGGSRGNPGPAAYGAVVRAADTGEVLAEVARAIGETTNNVAEYRGVLAGLQAAHRIDSNAIVEARLDSKLVVEQMSGRWRIKNPVLKPLALEVQRIFPPGRVIYTWVPRAQNTHADRLVNQALDGYSDDEASAVDIRGWTSGAAMPIPEQAGAQLASPANQLAAWAPDLGTPTTLILVRHGQTSMTADHRFSGGGVEGPALDEIGRKQAARVAEVLTSARAVAVVSSPMLRARQTAQSIASLLGTPVRVDDSWRECDFGAWDGLNVTEIGEHYPAEVARLYKSTTFAPPGGESVDDVFRRVAVAKDTVIDRYSGHPVVVVTHATPIRAIIQSTLEAPSEALYRLQPAPGSMTEVEIYADGTTAIISFGWRP
jgi:probable phosphoglycerate mutase